MHKNNIYTTNQANFTEGLFIENLNIINLSGDSFNISNINNHKLIISLPNLHNQDDILEIQKFDEILNDYDIAAFLIFNENILTIQKHQNKFNLKNIELISDFKLREFAKISGTFIYELEALNKSITILNKNNKIIYFNQLESINDRFPIIKGSL